MLQCRGCGWSERARGPRRARSRGPRTRVGDAGFERQRPERQCQCPPATPMTMTEPPGRAGGAAAAQRRTLAGLACCSTHGTGDIFALEGLATAAQAAAADSTPARLSQAETEYERLRAGASALNARHRWATDDEFEALLPTIASREEVRALNEQLSAPGSAAPAPQPAELVRLLLLDLAGWATGIRLAGQAFDAAPPEG